jgi:hypothetical protein
MQGTPRPKIGSTEHEKKEVVKTEPEKLAKRRRIVKRNYVDSLALPVGFARLEYLLVSYYPIVIKSSMDFKIQKIGWLTIWK